MDVCVFVCMCIGYECEHGVNLFGFISCTHICRWRWVNVRFQPRVVGRRVVGIQVCPYFDKCILRAKSMLALTWARQAASDRWKNETHEKKKNKSHKKKWNCKMNMYCVSTNFVACLVWWYAYAYLVSE